MNRGMSATTRSDSRLALGLSTPAWYVLGLGLVLFDATMTAAVVRRPVDEANPLLAALMGRVGVLPALGLRVVFGAALLTALALLARRHAQARDGLVLAGLIHAAVAAWHLLGPLAV